MTLAKQKTFVYAVPVDMASLDQEEQLYQEDVKAVKQWWTDSRWRYTKRPFTAEQIVAKRGNLKIQYPSNVQSKKLWNILEGRFKVCARMSTNAVSAVLTSPNRTVMLASPTVAWTPLCLRKWPNTLTQSMSRAGNVRQPLRLRMSHLLIWLTTHMYVRTSPYCIIFAAHAGIRTRSRTKYINCSRPNSSMTGSSGKSASARPKQIVARLRIPIS